MDLTENLAAKERQMQEVLSGSFGYQAGEGIFYGELAFLSMLAPSIATGIYNLPTTYKRASNYIYKKYDEIVNKVKNKEIDPEVAKVQLNGLNDQAKVIVDEMGVTNKHKNQILQAIAGKNVANISKTGDFTDVPDIRTVPDPTKSTGKAYGVYGGSSEADIAYTIELDKAALFHSGGKKKYSDYLTEAQRTEQGLKRGNIETQMYLRKQFIREGKFVEKTKGKQNLKAVADAQEERLIRRAEAFYEQNGRYPTEAELHFNTFGYSFNHAASKGLVDHSKKIRGLVKQNKIILSTADETRIGRKLKEGERFQEGIKAFEDQYNEVADKVSDLLNIDRTRVTDFFARGHSLRDSYFSRVPVELQEKLLRPNQLLTAGQNSRHIHYENSIIHFYNLKEEAMSYMKQILKGEQALSKTQLTALDDLVETFGVGVKENANNLQKASSVLKGIENNLQKIDNQMLEEGVYTPMYDPISNKQRIFGQSTGSKFDPFDPKRPKGNQTRVPPDITSQVASPADVRESYRRLSEKLKSIDPETGLPTATDKYGRALAKGGDPEKAPLKIRAFGNEGGDEEKLKRKPVFADYLSAKIDTAQRDVRIEEMPESQRKQMAFLLEDPYGGQDSLELEKSSDASVRYRLKEKDESISSIQAKIAREMIDAKPTKFPLTSFPKLLTDNVITKSMDRQMKTPFLILAAAANDIINKTGGEEKQFNERFPMLSEYLSRGYQPVPGTDQEAAYIDGIDEINRALESGVRNLGFNTMDLILGGIDLSGFGDGNLSERLRESYEKTAKNDPETFMGDMISLLVEFGVPGGLVTKLVTRLQKIMRLKGVNTMTRYIDDDIVGGARFAMQASNIAKRMGTGAVIFGAADVLGDGPYNTLTKMLPEDATLLPGKQIDTKNLSGKELAVANFKNRVRFGADGALIGGLFPLLGPPAWALTKGTASLPFKTIPGVNRSIFGGALQLAGVPLKVASDALAGKIPYTSKTIPLVGNAISYLGKKRRDRSTSNSSVCR